MTVYIINSPGSAVTRYPESIINDDTLIFNNTSTGSTGQILQWEVPSRGIYEIAAFGAQGGSSSVNSRGAAIKGKFELDKGEVIQILVGQSGMRVPTSSQFHAFGGGGSFVTKAKSFSSSSLSDLLIAAGGGGSSAQTSDAPINMRGSASRSGRTGSFSSGGANGSDGGTGSSVLPAKGFYSIVNDPSGNGNSYNGTGGFGGGGGPNGGYFNRAGGGGGFSGGGSGTANSNGVSYGGGGGSYNIGEDQENLEGVKSGHGQVVITAVAIGNVHFKDLAFSQTYTNSNSSLEYIHALLSLSTVDQETQTVETNELVRCEITVNGITRSQTDTTPYRANIPIEKNLLKEGSNTFYFKLVGVESGAEVEFEYEIHKENRDTFAYSRRLEHDLSHKTSGKISFIPGEGYELSGMGEGTLEVSIPSNGKSNIEQILVTSTSDVSGEEMTSYKTVNVSWDSEGYHSRTKVSLKDYIETIEIRKRRN